MASVWKPEVDHTSLDATDARQGRPGRPVLRVLIVSTLGAAMVLFLAWAAFTPAFRHTTPQSVTNPATAASFGGPASSSRARRPGTDR